MISRFSGKIRTVTAAISKSALAKPTLGEDGTPGSSQLRSRDMPMLALGADRAVDEQREDHPT